MYAIVTEWPKSALARLSNSQKDHGYTLAPLVVPFAPIERNGMRIQGFEVPSRTGGTYKVHVLGHCVEGKATIESFDCHCDQSQSGPCSHMFAVQEHLRGRAGVANVHDKDIARVSDKTSTYYFCQSQAEVEYVFDQYPAPGYGTTVMEKARALKLSFYKPCQTVVWRSNSSG